MSKLSIVVLAFLCALVTVFSIPLNRYPILLSHDAATGELNPDRDHVVDDWTRTQSKGLVDQLNCGARGFDYRPYLKGDAVYAHHGPVVVHKLMNESVQEIQKWASQHPQEFVLLYVTACDGDDGCMDAAKKVLASNNVHTISVCDNLNQWTVESVMAVSNLLALVECVDEQYDSTLNCYSHKFKCYDDESSTIPWTAFESYMEQATKAVPTSDGRLWMAQAHWQSDAESVVVGTLHRSSLLLDESRSGMNSWVVTELQQSLSGDSKYFKEVNLVEVDNVCDRGTDILELLKKRAALLA